MRRTIGPLLALIVSAAVGLSGCATRSSGPEVQEFVSSVNQGMTRVSSYRGTISMDIDGGGAAGTMTGTMGGTVQEGKAVNSHAEINLAVGSTRIDVDVVMIGSRTYVGGSTVLDAVPAADGKKWVLVDADSSNSTVRKLSESMSSMSSNNISGMVAFVDATRSISKEGTATVDGVPTTEYQVDLDPSKIPNTVAGAATPDSVEATLFVDDRGRLRRAVMDLSMDEASAKLTMDITDYDTDVDVEEPAGSAVYSG